jgi:integrase
VLVALAERFPDANQINEDDARHWLRGLVNQGRSAATVRNIWRRAANVVFGWAAREKRVATNPFAGVRLTVPRPAPQTRSKAFTQDEAAMILRAALSASSPARRWASWLQAYSGARGGEITQLRKEDVRKIEGIWCLVLTPEAGSVKTRVARTVPIHEHLVDQGFLDFVAGCGAGPLFYVPDDKPRGRPQSVLVLKDVQRWVRGLGVRGVSPTHGWRHLWRQRAVRAGIDEQFVDQILGHRPASIGRSYGQATVADLAAALARFPRFEI